MYLKKPRKSNAQELRLGKTARKALVFKPQEPAGPIGRKNPGYSRAWMQHWLSVAAGATDVSEVCEKSQTSIADYLEGRMVDREFDAACRIFEQVVELRIIENIRGQAAKGDLRAQALYFKVVRRPAFTPDFGSWHALPSPPPSDPPMAPEVADAMIVAGLAAYESLQQAAASNCKY